MVNDYKTENDKVRWGSFENSMNALIFREYYAYDKHAGKNKFGTPINLLKTKRNLLYIRNQSVPRSKHFPPQL